MSNLEKMTAPTLERQLLTLLETGTTTTDLIRTLETRSSEIKSIVGQMQYGLTKEKALTDPKIFQLRKTLKKSKLIAVICAILKAFCDSIKASKTMDAVDILEAAEAIEERYSHDSVKDIILALKEAKTGVLKFEGKPITFYNAIDLSIILKILDAYFENKAIWLEQRHNELKNQHSQSSNETTSMMVAMERSREEKEKHLAKEKRDFIRQKAQEKETARLNYLASQNEL